MNNIAILIYGGKELDSDKYIDQVIYKLENELKEWKYKKSLFSINLRGKNYALPQNSVLIPDNKGKDWEEYVLKNHPEFKKIHESGWLIEGFIDCDDDIFFVNDFKASHPLYGKVFGNTWTIVYSDSKEAYDDFIKNHEYITLW